MNTRSLRAEGKGAIASCLLAFGLVTLAPSHAEARVQRELEYRYDQVWGTLVRLLRVDYRYPVEEQDESHGFVLFRYMEYGRSHTASVELIRIPDAESRVRIVVQAQGIPMHLEAEIVDDLERKLRTEIGRPQRPPVVASRDGAPSTVPRLRDRPEDAERPHGTRGEEPSEAPATDATRDSAAAGESGESARPPAPARRGRGG